MNKIDQIIAEIDFARYWKVFIFSTVAVFAMVVLPHLINLYTKPIISPVPQPNVINDVKDKLIKQPKNSFHLQNTSSFLKAAYAAGEYQDSKAYLAINFKNGDVLEQKQISTRLPIASLTKIMTAIVSLDLAKPSEVFEVSNKASNQIPTKIGVLPGEKMSLEELLNGALLTSANDAVEVIKEGIDKKYGDQIFIQAMNEKAKLIGLKNTYFTNPQGFDYGNPYSSVEDLAVLSHYSLSNYPLIADIVKKDFQHLDANQNHRQQDLYNWNGLIDVYPGTYGIKIGNTEDAGYTTTVLSERNGQTVLAVLLGAPGVLERDFWTSQLLDSSFQQLANLEPVNITKSDLKAKYATWKYWH